MEALAESIEGAAGMLEERLVEGDDGYVWAAQPKLAARGRLSCSSRADEKNLEEGRPPTMQGAPAKAPLGLAQRHGKSRSCPPRSFRRATFIVEIAVVGVASVRLVATCLGEGQQSVGERRSSWFSSS